MAHNPFRTARRRAILGAHLFVFMHRLLRLVPLGGVPLLLLAALPAVAQPVRVAGAAAPYLPAGSAHARIAPGGDFVAFSTPDYTGLWVRETATGAVRQLSSALGAGTGARWSPDGGALVLREADDRADGRYFTIVAYTPDGARTPLTAPQPNVAGLPVWSADGASVLLPTPGGVERLATGRVPVDAAGAAYVADPAGGVAEVTGAVRVSLKGLPDGPVLAAVPSPDGRQVALQVMGHGVFVAGPRGVVALGRGEAPTWSPDGRFVAFMVTDDDGHRLTGADLYVATADGAQRWALTSTPRVFEQYPAWTPDGTALLYDDPAAQRVMRLPLTVAAETP